MNKIELVREQVDKIVQAVARCQDDKIRSEASIALGRLTAWAEVGLVWDEEGVKDN